MSLTVQILYDCRYFTGIMSEGIDVVEEVFFVFQSLKLCTAPVSWKSIEMKR